MSDSTPVDPVNALSDSTRVDPVNALSDSTPVDRQKLAELWAYYEAHWTPLPAWATEFGEWFFPQKEALSRSIQTDLPINAATRFRSWLMAGSKLRLLSGGGIDSMADARDHLVAELDLVIAELSEVKGDEDFPKQLRLMGRAYHHLCSDLAQITAIRDALIVEARRRGMSLRAIGHLVMLDHTRVKQILDAQDPEDPLSPRGF